ncbi:MULTISPECIES: SDR family NAD(P)-dependent oxidoreductase [Pontibacillus]|uniref:SDR family NAD(P)-dependent oxidoreductase n=1 Tax=Pontibacillus chungwhensis TaxID=265426 RepID=A0ABY8UW88_9BACI|nr:MULTISPECIES: SDR family NAD(P)-dependent oxidoreductase [Pontibacillus]MCD5323398.1 SDR family NAD(P)-dependent oxidoreductase [Pontibacillus sp. HN14]WIF96779.1 SDR family NAD(P)-dependent oxidoreductase [Pontibacillus chungwhensis]
MAYTVITGASSGIGYEAAIAFAERGKDLILVARREEKLEELKAEIEKQHSVNVVVKTADLAEPERVHALYEEIKSYPLETFVNNAGFGNFDPVAEQDLGKIQKMLRLNIEALTVLSTLFVRDYENKEGTQLLNISSAGGYNIVGGAVTYCSTKFYVSAFTEGLAQELEGKGAKMRAKVLAPAATETEFMKRSLDVEDVSYEGNVAQYHTAKEMAHFLLDLYDSNKVVGIVDGETYEFHLKDPIYPYVERSTK